MKMIKRKRLISFCILFSIFLFCSAHVGSPNIVFEGSAGPYKLLVNIQPPEVVPGLAQVSVRIPEGEINEVSMQTVYFRYQFVWVLFSSLAFWLHNGILVLSF